MITGIIVLVISVFVAFMYIGREKETLFQIVQRIFFYIAPPFAVVFLLGLVWRRANATAAVTTIIGGFLFLLLLQEGIRVPYTDIVLVQPLWDAIPFLTPYQRPYYHSALLTWIFSMIVMIVTSLLTAPPPKEQVERIIWNRSYLSLPPEEQQRYSGWRDFRIWWLLFITLVLSIYGFFLWFDFSHN
jgi:SSS family solute:Na+ symporter